MSVAFASVDLGIVIAPVSRCCYINHHESLADMASWPSPVRIHLPFPDITRLLCQL